MTYAQKDYQQKMGQGEFTIAEAGSLLTAFSNLLERFGNSYTPAILEEGLAELAIDSSKGLSWGHVSFFNPKVGVFAIGDGAPSFNESIVKLVHTSKLTNAEVVSYAVVSSLENGTIIDSYDGLEKSWDVYGGPKGYVTFVEYPLITTDPIKPVPVEPEAPKTFSAKIHLSGYLTSTDAAEGVDEPAHIVAPGEYFIYSIINDMFNVTTDPNTIGYWINPEKNVIDDTFDLGNDDEVDASGGIYTDEEAVAIPVTVIPPNPDKWKASFKGHLGIVEAVATEDIIVHDLDNVNDSKPMAAGSLVPVAGIFEKDGDKYYRTAKSVENGVWYGIPLGKLRKSDDQSEADLEELLDQINLDTGELSGHDRMVKGAATIEGKIMNVFKRKKKQETL